MKFIKDFIDGLGVSLPSALASIFIAAVVLIAFSSQVYEGFKFISGLLK